MVSLVWDELHYRLTIAETIDIETTHIQQTLVETTEWKRATVLTGNGNRSPVNTGY